MGVYRCQKEEGAYSSGNGWLKPALPAGFRACVCTRQIPRSESRYGISITDVKYIDKLKFYQSLVIKKFLQLLAGSWCRHKTLLALSIGLAGDRSPLVPAGKFESEQACATRGVLTQVVSGLYKGFFI